MYRVKLADLVPGMVVAREVTAPDGRLLLNVGAVIKARFIPKLEYLGVREVWVEGDPFLPPPLPQPPAVRRVRGPEEVFQDAVQAISEVFTDLRCGRALELPRVRRTAEAIVKQVLAQQHVLSCLGQIRDYDDYTFAHSVQVCLFAIALGRSLGYGFDDLVELGTGALLHDVGKTQIPLSLLNKPGYYNEKEYRAVKHHAAYGERILRRTEGVGVNIIRMAAEHHEWYNGAGYFRGLRGLEIHEFGRIGAIVDVYDAMTTDRSYRHRLLPHLAVEYLVGLAGSHFDPGLTRLFVQTVAIFPLDATVELTTGEIGRIIDVQKDLPTRPVVLILYDEKGRPVFRRRVRDLRRETTVFVTRLLSCGVVGRWAS
ncbi:MAG: HD-GYP domain-containing protein [Bacillota bacterium]|nr:HD-GYP domain-containing protein [Bacillota bacterium]